MPRTNGNVRHLDQMRRNPKNCEETSNISHNDEAVILTEDKNIVFMNDFPACLICGSSVSLFEFKDKLVCQECTKEAKDIFIK